MSFDLEPLYRDLQTEARRLAAAVEPFAVEADNADAVHPGVREALRSSGLASLMVPGAYGGRFERVDPLAICVAREVLMGTSAHLDALFALQGIGSYAIAIGGSEEQKSAWLPRIARLDALAGFAVTEPEAGSDLKAITTSITPDGDSLIVNGQKSFISNAGAADYYIVLARESNGEGFSAVLVPAETPGVCIEPGAELIAPHVLGDVRFDAVRVPASARLGAPGSGFDLALSTLAVFRASVGAAAVGLAQAAMEEAVRHARTRVQFGRPLARHGPVASLLADCWSDVETARLLVYRAGTLARENPLAAIHHSSMAKLVATEAAARVVDRAVQVMGRWGLIRDSKVERLYRQARPMRIYEGASEVLRLGIARALVTEVP